MTCLLQDSNNYDGGTLAVSGADFFTFLGKAVPSIYAHGDSYWGIGSDVTHLKIDNRDTRMRSLYREEGTLYSYYRFLKIRGRGGHITMHREQTISLSMIWFSGIRAIYPFI